MRNLGKLKLSDAKVMDNQEMKAITGGQISNKFCRNTGTSSGINGDTSDIVCEGECPTVGDVTGTGKQPIKQTCKPYNQTINFKTIITCMCQ